MNTYVYIYIKFTLKASSTSRFLQPRVDFPPLFSSSSSPSYSFLLPPPLPPPPPRHTSLPDCFLDSLENLMPCLIIRGR